MAYNPYYNSMNGYPNGQQPPEPRVNKIAIIGFLLTVVGFAMIVNPFGLSILPHIAMLMILAGIVASVAAWAFKPWWMAALGCAPGMIIIAIFIIMCVAVGQYRPPKEAIEYIDSLLVIDEADTLDTDDIITNIPDTIP